MKYKNRKTGAVIDTASVISGGDWEKIEEVPETQKKEEEVPETAEKTSRRVPKKETRTVRSTQKKTASPRKKAGNA